LCGCCLLEEGHEGRDMRMTSWRGDDTCVALESCSVYLRPRSGNLLGCARAAAAMLRARSLTRMPYRLVARFRVCEAGACRSAAGTKLHTCVVVSLRVYPVCWGWDGL